MPFPVAGSSRAGFMATCPISYLTLSMETVVPHYIIESYRHDHGRGESACFHKAPIKANDDAEAKGQAPIVTAQTKPTSYKVISVERKGRKEIHRVVFDSTKDGADA
jgi:hypothetical protein